VPHVYLAVEHAALYPDFAADAETTRVLAAADVNTADAVGDTAHGAACLADNASCAVGGSGDGAADNQVLYRCAVHVAEWCGVSVVVCVRVADGQGVALAVERAAKGVAFRARHAADLDVGAQLHGLAAEAAVAVVVIEGATEDAPAYSALDGKNVAACGEVVGRGVDGTIVGCEVRSRPTDIAGTALHGAVEVVVIVEDTITTGTCNCTKRCTYISDGDTNGDVVTGCTSIIAYNATKETARAVTRHGNCAGTVGDYAPIAIITCDAAVIFDLVVSNDVNEDVGSDVAVADDAAAAIGVCIAHDAAGIMIAGDAAIRKDDAVNGCVVDIPEEAYALVPNRHTDAADGMFLAIVAALEVEVSGAYAAEITLRAAAVVPVAVVAEGDVSRLLERLAAGIVARVDVGGKGIERCRIGNLIVPARRVVRQAADGFLCPGRGYGEQREEQGYNYPPFTGGVFGDFCVPHHRGCRP